MVNLLQHTLPDQVAGLKINTSYRLMIAFADWLERHEGVEIIPEVVLKQVFISEIKDTQVATAALLWWYTCGAEQQAEETDNNPKKKTAKPYSFLFDEGAIAADFAQYYGIRILSTDMHWFEFHKLLINLPNESQFKKRIYYRTANIDDINKHERDSFIKLRKLYKIENPHSAKTSAEREQNFQERIARAYQDMQAHILQEEMQKG